MLSHSPPEAGKALHLLDRKEVALESAVALSM